MRAQQIGFVNAMRRTNTGDWHGDNFDGAGFVAGLLKNGHVVKGKRVLILGAGGAGSSIAVALLEGDAASIFVYDTNESKMKQLKDNLGRHFPGRVQAGLPDLRSVDIVVNATPLGMRDGDPVPVEVALLSPTTLVADVITTPVVTPLIREAQAMGCPTQLGVDMIKGQTELRVDFMLGADPGQ
jgi:shikimate dehydrogenase